MLLTATVVGAMPAPAQAVTDEHPDFLLIEADLEHILKQIQISEAHAAGGPLLCPEPTDTSGKCVSDPALPYGLRTVDGSFNNLLDEEYGAADRPFPKLLPAHWRTADAAPPHSPPNPPGATDVCGTASTCYSMSAPGHFVYDSDARMVSNLIVDQTATNPAVVAAAANTEGSTTDADGSVFIPNTAPDEGLSAPFNMWFVLFGQFFDHGLDLVNKGGNGTIVVPLRRDDPLWDSDGPDNVLEDDPSTPGDEAADNLSNNFLVLTRATRFPGPDGEVGTADDEHNNQTTPYVDQNQTYTSHPSHQVFVREYELRDGRPHDTGRLLDGTLPDGGRGGLATWNDVKKQAREVLGIDLGSNPAEPIGPGNNDFPDVQNVPQVVTDLYGNFVPGPNGFPLLVEQGGTVEGDPAAPISTENAKRTNHAFLDDIAHGATPARDDLSGYDNVTLGEHFITGDGRGNENIGLTAVHQVFHAEHNRMMGEIQATLDEPGNAELKNAYMGVANDYQEVLGDPLPSGPEADDWSYEQRLFQAARFATEMQYQHLVFEEFARRIQPMIDPIVFNENSYDATIDPAIVAEYAHVVYRFGHSMLTEDIHRSGIQGAENVSLLDGFLNPRTYDNNGTLTPEQAAGAIVNGTTNQVGGQIDEFVVDTLRNNLLGLPLDLATINLVRAREVGVPPLQTARRTFFEATGDPMLEPYASWRDFGLNLKNGNNFGRELPSLPEGTYPDSTLVNFVAAYGKHPSVVAAQTIVEKREAANLLVNGGPGAPADREDFLTSSGAWANVAGDTITGLEEVDFWIGGLAEALEPFGGMLGSTFNFVFEQQLEQLQFGDRFYYLFRNQGNQLFAALENNSFAGLIRRNTDASLLPADIFSVHDPFIDLGNLPSPLPEGLVQMTDGTYRWDGDEHVEMHGTPGEDRMQAGQGDDALWGYGDRDRIEGGSGNDALVGGEGDDIVTDTFGDDNIKGNWGNDALKGGSGDDLILGGHDDDFVASGNDFKTVFAGTGDDVIGGGPGRDTVFGGEDDDWIEGGAHADLLQGDNANQFQNDPNGGNDIVDGGPGNDDIEGEGGDDILIGLPDGTDRHEGMKGYDFVTYRGTAKGVDVDLRFTTLQRPDNQAVRDRFDLIEAVSGGAGDDVIRGMANSVDDIAEDEIADELMTQDTLDMIGGLRELLDPGHEEDYTLRFLQQNVGFDTDGPSNLLLGGPGSDHIQGRSGNDFLEADAELDVYLEDSTDGTRFEEPRQAQTGIFDGSINPGDLDIVRELRVDETDTGVDTAVFGANRESYTITDLGDDYWRVAHDRSEVEAEESEGNDVIHGFEQVEFADGCFVLSTMESCGVYGHAFVDYTSPLTEDDMVTGRVVFDGDMQVTDPTQIRFRWEFAEEEDLTAAEDWLAADVQDLDRATSCSVNGGGHLVCMLQYRAGDLVVENLLRLRVTFNDGEATRSILSLPTSEIVTNENDPPTRPELSSNDPMIGEVIRVDADSLQDADGLSEAGETLQWVWQAENSDGTWEDVATNPYNITGYVPTEETHDRRLRVSVAYTDDLGTAENVSSSPTSPVGGVIDPGPPVPTAPAAPAIAGVSIENGAVLLTWERPSDDGGSPITGFVISGSANDVPMARTWAAPSDATSLRIAGLEPDPALAYTFSVAAHNAAGTGPTSGTSSPVVVEEVQPEPEPEPEPEPTVNQAATGAPMVALNHRTTKLSARAGTVDDADGMGAVSWTWERRIAGRWSAIAGSRSRLWIDDSLRGRRVRTVLSFTDGAGNAEARTSRAVWVPRVAPGRPQSLRAQPGRAGGARTVLVRWADPVSTGGRRLAGYRVTVVRAGNQRRVATMRLDGDRNRVAVRLPRGVFRVEVRAWTREGLGRGVTSRRVRSR